MVDKKQVIQIIKDRHGIISASHAFTACIAPKTLYAMGDEGILLPISRGIYRLQDAVLPSNPDIVTVSMRIP